MFFNNCIHLLRFAHGSLSTQDNLFRLLMWLKGLGTILKDSIAKKELGSAGIEATKFNSLSLKPPLPWNLTNFGKVLACVKV